MGPHAWYVMSRDGAVCHVCCEMSSFNGPLSPHRQLLQRKKDEKKREREEKETEDMMSEDRSACGRAFGDVLGGLKLKKRMLDWGGCVYEWVGPGDEEYVGDK